ncbi:hypothetical protein [Nocardia fluminea]|uniref:Uncharacterized protein n=1 Tax=Nocardia fluminea TaxID=134984 RepID=A0A2N3VBA2_9NOCA|nr:hypothetical protein [Nocardia fluminea]PKV78910.1 hypothetical protein ATK86_3294 [Nocardia fluminea]
MSKLVRIAVISNPEWTTIRVPRQARPVRARRAPGGVVVGWPPGSEPTSDVVVYSTYWEVPSNALTGEETYLIRRGVLPDRAAGHPSEPPLDEVSESGMLGATALFAEDLEFFWIYRDLFQSGSGYPPNRV